MPARAHDAWQSDLEAEAEAEAEAEVEEEEAEEEAEAVQWAKRPPKQRRAVTCGERERRKGRGISRRERAVPVGEWEYEYEAEEDDEEEDMGDRSRYPSIGDRSAYSSIGDRNGYPSIGDRSGYSSVRHRLRLPPHSSVCGLVRARSAGLFLRVTALRQSHRSLRDAGFLVYQFATGRVGTCVRRRDVSAT